MHCFPPAATPGPGCAARVGVSRHDEATQGSGAERKGPEYKAWTVRETPRAARGRTPDRLASTHHTAMRADQVPVTC
ncbi:hypothetical protein JCM9957A_02460 [Kineosporia succinea]